MSGAAVLAADGAKQTGFLGRSVALSFPWVLVGAPGDNTNGAGPGAAYAFDLPSGHLLFRCAASDSQPYDLFGASVACDGALVAVGAPGRGDHGPYSGAVAGAWSSERTDRARFE